MSVSDELRIAPPISYEPIPPSNDSQPHQDWEGLRGLIRPLPLGANTRNGFALFLSLALIALFWQPLMALILLSQTQDHYSHIVLIPVFFLYLLYRDREAILSSMEWSPIPGTMLFGVGGLLYWFSTQQSSASSQLSMVMLSLVVMSWGVFFLLYGLNASRKVAFALLFLLLIVPLPDSLLNMIVVFLQTHSANASDMLFSAIGMPFYREGFVFKLSNFSVLVAEECSGIRSTISLFITSLVAGHLFLRSVWGKLSLTGIVIPLAIIKNAFRIVGLTLLANYVDPSFITDSALHRFGGIPLFVLSLAILLSLTWLVRNLEKRGESLPT